MTVFPEFNLVNFTHYWEGILKQSKHIGLDRGSILFKAEPTEINRGFTTDQTIMALFYLLLHLMQTPLFSLHFC